MAQKKAEKKAQVESAKKGAKRASADAKTKPSSKKIKPEPQKAPPPPNEEDPSEEEGSEEEVPVKPAPKAIKKLTPASKKASKKAAKAVQKPTPDEEVEEDESNEKVVKKPTKGKLISLGSKSTSKKSVAPISADVEMTNQEESPEEDEDIDDNEEDEQEIPNGLNESVDDDDDDDDEDEDEDEDEENDEEDEPDSTPNNKATGEDTEEGDEEGKEGEEEEEEKQKDADSEDMSQKQEARKTLFVGNLSYTADESMVRDFFGEVATVEAVRIGMNESGRSRGFCHVDFATDEDLQKALEMSGQSLAGRAISCDIAGSRNPGESGGKNRGNQSRGDGLTVFVKNFDKFQEEDAIRNQLTEMFGECGEVKTVRIPTDRDSGSIKGFAFIEFDSPEAVSKAGELNGSEMGGRSIVVDTNVPGRGESGGRGRGRGRGGFRGRGGRGRGGYSGSGR